MSVKDNNSPHFWWLICLLSVVIIALVSYILSERVLYAYDIMEYISYASVILSITLSIFAILYTYTSNVQIQQQFEKINTAANNITSTSESLTSTGNKLNENLETILTRLESIDGKQDKMTEEMSSINQHFNFNTKLIADIKNDATTPN